jgi:hypothetical protein
LSDNFIYAAQYKIFNIIYKDEPIMAGYYSFYVVRANETASDPRIAQAIINHKMTGEDVICIATDGYVGQLERVRDARAALGNFTTTDPEELGRLRVAQLEAEWEAQQAAKNNPAPVEAETPQQ